MANVCSYYEDKVVFATGCTGVLGSILVEKILRCLNIKQLILMIRPKRGKSLDERIKQYTNDIVFSRLDKTIFNNKVIWLQGDLLFDNFGLPADDLLMLQNSVNVIFHVAATVRFVEPLAVALKVNLKSTKIMLDIAAECKNLESFVYVSTAYSNFPNTLVEEKVYKQKVTPEFVVNMLKFLDDAAINKFESVMIDPFPNTYTFSKGITEVLVEQYAKKFPISIFRPGAVITSYQEPFPGWINKGAGSNSLIIAAALGRMRVFRTNEGNISCVPVDMCANAMLGIGWECFRNRSLQCKVYNFTSNLEVRDYFKHSLKNLANNPFDNTSYYPFVIIIQSPMQYKILYFTLHILPAVILDLPGIILHGKLSKLTQNQKNQARIDILNAFFTKMDWIFRDGNIKNLWSSLNENEQMMFNFNLYSINWEEYLPHSCYGLKKYCLKNNMDKQSLDEAKMRYNRLRCIHLLTKYGLLPLLALKLASKL